LGFLHRFDPERSDERLAGLCVRLTPCRALLPTSWCSLARSSALPQSPGSACGAEHSRPPRRRRGMTNARAALQSLRFNSLVPACRHAGIVLFGSAARSESLASYGTARTGWVVPLCRWPFPRLCGFPARDLADHRSVASHILSRVSPPSRVTRAKPSRPAAASQPLSWALVPYST
jgi:hypothetical protein